MSSKVCSYIILVSVNRFSNECLRSCFLERLLLRALIVLWRSQKVIKFQFVVNLFQSKGNF